MSKENVDVSSQKGMTTGTYRSNDEEEDDI
jgi:hypothetical protein